MFVQSGIPIPSDDCNQIKENLKLQLQEAAYIQTKMVYITTSAAHTALAVVPSSMDNTASL